MVRSLHYSYKNIDIINNFQGTTGLPKGAVLSHHNLVNNAFTIGSRIQYDKKVQMCANFMNLKVDQETFRTREAFPVLLDTMYFYLS